MSESWVGVSVRSQVFPSVADHRHFARLCGKSSLQLLVRKQAMLCRAGLTEEVLSALLDPVMVIKWQQRR